MIPKDIIQTIIETARIEEVVSDFVNLKKRGANYIGLCPFHNEKTPSFNVSPSRGIFKCFGCGKVGDSVKFVMEHEHYTYPEALRYVAKKYNIEIEEQEPTPEYLSEQGEKESLYNISQFAQAFFSDFLKNHDEGKAIGLTYLRERDFTDAGIEKFQLGYCPEAWSEFTNHALKNGYNIKYLIKSGLTVERSGGDHYDRFRGRAIFPIHNLSGRVLGFGGRILKKDPTKPKYVNSPENEIYNKSKVLYGLYFAKDAIIKADNCLLVEGYTDVISLYQNGLQNVVASSGTSLTIDQIRLIKRYTNNITILYDGDEAGLKASFRGIDLILEQGMNVKVVLFPENEDPDTFARKHRPVEIKTYIAENSKDFIRLKTGLLLNEVKNDPVQKANLIKDVVNSISLIPSDITRREYTKACSQIMDVDEQALIFELNRVLRNRFKSKTTEPPPVTEDEVVQTEQFTTQQVDIQPVGSLYQESEIIRLLLTFGNKEIVFESENEFGRVEAFPVTVSRFIINDLSQDEIHFEHPVYRKIFEEIVNKISETNESIELQHFTSHENPEIAQITAQLLSNPYELSENWKKNKIYVNGEEQLLRKTVTTSVLALKANKIAQILQKIQKEIKQTGDIDLQVELLRKYQRHKDVLAAIHKELGRVISQ